MKKYRCAFIRHIGMTLKYGWLKNFEPKNMGSNFSFSRTVPPRDAASKINAFLFAE